MCIKNLPILTRAIEYCMSHHIPPAYGQWLGWGYPCIAALESFDELQFLGKNQDLDETSMMQGDTSQEPTLDSKVLFHN